MCNKVALHKCINELGRDSHGENKKNAKIKQQREITHTGRRRATFTVCSSNYLLSDVKVGIIRVLGFLGFFAWN